MILQIALLTFASSSYASPASVLPAKTDSVAAQEASQQAATAESTLDIEWETIEDATSYEVKLSPETGGAPLKFETKDTKLSEKLPQGTYKLQIRSKDKSSGYFGKWSEETEVDVVPKTVKLISPAEGAEIAEPKEKRTQVQFAWSPIAKAKEYTLRIWFDDEKNARSFKSNTNKKILSLPSGKAYAWQVTFLTKKSIGYLAAPQIGNFKVLGKQLLKPIIVEKLFSQSTEPSKEVSQELKWKSSPGAKSYSVKLFSKGLDEEEWHPYSENQKDEKNEFSFSKLKPGDYKIEVVAQAPNHVSSESAIYKFTVKPTEAELALAMKKAVR